MVVTAAVGVDACGAPPTSDRAGDSGAGVLYRRSMACSDFRLSQRTAQRFAEVDYTTAAFMHCPQIGSGAKREVDAFLARWSPD